MPLRIMYWNIEIFGINKFLTSAWDRTASRAPFIQTTILEQNPDVLVVGEVRSNAATGFGGIISDTSGGPAVQALLWYLRGVQPAANWSVVPPLVLSPGGHAEGIAVLFKSARLTFEGPRMWNGAAAVAPGGGGAAYGGFWTGALPAGNSTILNLPQDTLAGQHQFFPLAGGAAITFPAATSRSIWFTQFTDNATARILSLFSVHMPPKRAPARRGLAALAQVPEIAGAVGATEDRVILGDFNVNLNDLTQANVFQHLTGGPAVLAAYPVCGHYTTQFTTAGGVLGTMLKSPKRASTKYGPNYYDYGGRDPMFGTLLGLDNAFVARGGGAAAANAQAVANRVVGLGGGSVAMIQTIPALVAGVAAGGARARRFRNCVNYGRIGGKVGASDHMPIRLELP